MKNLTTIIIKIVFILIFTTAIANAGCNAWDPNKDGLSYWNIDKSNGSIELVSVNGKKSIKISRSDKGRTFITKKIVVPRDGDYGFKAIIMAKNIVTGDKRWERGKFQVRLFDNWGRNLSSKRNYYPNSDFNNIPSWSPLVFSVENVKKGQIMEVRIGLQEAKGTVLLSDFEFCFLQ